MKTKPCDEIVINRGWHLGPVIKAPGDATSVPNNRSEITVGSGPKVPLAAIGDRLNQQVDAEAKTAILGLLVETNSANIRSHPFK